jgi:hypothetical protein
MAMLDQIYRATIGSATPGLEQLKEIQKKQVAEGMTWLPQTIVGSVGRGKSSVLETLEAGALIAKFVKAWEEEEKKKKEKPEEPNAPGDANPGGAP